MIGLDTNVIIRYIMQDDPVQSQRANHFIEHSVQQNEILWISQITLCEVSWVLLKAYKLSKPEVLTVLRQLLRTRQIQIEEDHVVRAALQDYEEKNRIGFSDCLIGHQNAAYECAYTYTFDKDAVKSLPTVFKMIPKRQ